MALASRTGTQDATHRDEAVGQADATKQAGSDADLLECDLIMKGGITSGVVYPGAIAKIAETYRLRDIGGSSAGAIAATFAAAAEYRRQTGGGRAGFNAILSAGDELGCRLKSLFQPTPALRPLFSLLEARISTPHPTFGRKLAYAWAFLKAFWPVWLAMAALLVVVVMQGVATGGPRVVGLQILLVLLLAVAAVIGWIWVLLFETLPKNDFGLCSGLRPKGSKDAAFCEWIADQIDGIAGKTGPGGTPGEPLTIGDLGNFGDCKGIRVAAMTTDLSSGRPYQLPLKTRTHWFSRGEFEALFPARIVNYLCAKGERRIPRATDPKGVPRDLYKLPVGGDFPVLLVARLSLSFPLLIRAVPLWREDGERCDDRRLLLRRCLFSDGGISSNFPIHFFDALLPSRPTFGIALDSLDCERHQQQAAGKDDRKIEWPRIIGVTARKRLSLPSTGSEAPPLPVREIDGPLDFVSRIVNVAKDWQDTLQSRLPGYADRIVTVRLVEGVEGGMKLDMGKPTVRRLIRLGRQAGTLLASQFDMSGHRHQRAITNFSVLEPALASLAQAYLTPLPDRPGGTIRSYGWILTHHGLPDGASGACVAASLKSFADELSELGLHARLRYNAGTSISQLYPSDFDGTVRLVASPDLAADGPRSWGAWCAPVTEIRPASS